MKSNNFYYSAAICDFLKQSKDEILGQTCFNDPHSEIRLQQKNTWESEITILKNQLAGLEEGQIIFEYTIPRMGKRVDVVILYESIV